MAPESKSLCMTHDILPSLQSHKDCLLVDEIKNKIGTV